MKEKNKITGFETEASFIASTVYFPMNSSGESEVTYIDAEGFNHTIRGPRSMGINRNRIKLEITYLD